MVYNYSKLSGKISEVFGTQTKFTQAMDLSERTISLKLNGKIEWKQSEIVRACEILGIKEREIPLYFFNYDVQ